MSRSKDPELNRLTTTEDVRRWLEAGREYLDVRSEQEYQQGHIPGAFNIPWMHGTLAGLQPNPEFAAQAERWLRRERPVLVGCRSGQRAKAACLFLQARGFDVTWDPLGFEGTRDAFGRLRPGWSRQGLPVEQGLESTRKPPSP